MKDIYDKSVEEEFARHLHEWYLEATDQEGSKYNHEAVVPYDDLPEGSKIIDRYIAKKVLSYLKHHTLSLIYAEIERVESMMKEPLPELEGADGGDCRSYNQALTDHLTYLKEQRELITNPTT